MNILVIDDQPIIGTIIHDALAGDSIGVFYADSGLRGVEMLRDHLHEISLIILDYHMPDMDGWDTCALLREIAPCIPIVPCTASAEPLTLHELGCLPVLRKADLMHNRARVRAAILHTMNQSPPQMAIPPATLTRLTGLIRDQHERREPVEYSRSTRVSYASTLEAIIVARVATRSVAIRALLSEITPFQIGLETTKGSDVGAWLTIRSRATQVIVVGSQDIDLLDEIEEIAASVAVLVIAAGLADALILDAHPLITAMVIEHPNTTVVQIDLAAAAGAMLDGKRYRPDPLTTPFVLPDGRKCIRKDIFPVLLHELAGDRDIEEIAERLGMTARSYRRVRLRLYERLRIEPDQRRLREWVDTWWREHQPLA
ncbi:response regulator [bacterium]|nr:response regulator [bacterium]